jgi:hypothetical protein
VPKLVSAVAATYQTPLFRYRMQRAKTNCFF